MKLVPVQLSDAIQRLGADLIDTADRLDETYARLFEATCSEKRSAAKAAGSGPTSPAEPADEDQEDEDLDGFNRAWLAYLEAGAAIQKYVAAKEDIIDEAIDVQDEAIWGLIKVPSPALWAVKRKLELLMHFFDPSRWTDGRDNVSLFHPSSRRRKLAALFVGVVRRWESRASQSQPPAQSRS